MSPHPLADLAWKVHDLARRPKARAWFLAQVRVYLDRRKAPGAGPPPHDKLDDDLELTLDEKCARLAGLHDEVCTGEAKLGPKMDLEVPYDQALEVMAWAVLRAMVRDRLGEEYRRHVASWLEDVRADLQTTVVEPEATSNDSASSDASILESVVAIVSGDNAVAIMRVARDDTKSADERMRAICAIDNRVLGWTSPKWSDVLGVSAAAVRQTEWWRIDRVRLKG